VGQLSRSREYETFLEPFWNGSAKDGICVSVGDGHRTCDAIKNLIADNNWLGLFIQADHNEAQNLATWSHPYHLHAIVECIDWREGLTRILRAKNMMRQFDMLHIDVGPHTLTAFQEMIQDAWFTPRVVLCACDPQSAPDIIIFANENNYKTYWEGPGALAFVLGE